MRFDQIFRKPEEGNDSLDTFIRQTIGREPVLSFTRAGDSPVQWIQLLHALEQQDLPGWPLLSPPKVQMQKCDKCIREFCSPINYRRHKRLHRRSLNNDKDFAKNRCFLGAFWDKLSLDEAKEALSLKDVMLENVSGSTVIKALASFIRKPGFSSLPQVYVKAGAALLDVIQARPSRFPITSLELFSILDDASETTFLCAGTALSMQKFVFDGEVGKIGLEMKNLIACTSFLVEKELVKAWFADKDAEALRCHKLLVEEEEAAQKRQIEILERRRLKKLRQKEQKAKDQIDQNEAGAKKNALGFSEILPAYEETPRPLAASNSDSSTSESLSDPAQPLLEHTGSHSRFEDADIDTVSDIPELNYFQTVDHQTQQRNDRRHLAFSRRSMANPQRGLSNVIYLAKLGPIQKHVSQRDKRPAAPIPNSHKIWTKKTKTGNGGEVLNSKVQRDSRCQLEQNENSRCQLEENENLWCQLEENENSRCQPVLSENSKYLTEQNESCEVLIGSIAVTLDQFASHQPPKSSEVNENVSKSLVKLGRSMGRNEVGGLSIVQNCEGKSEEATVTSKATYVSLTNGSCSPCDTTHSWVDSAEMLEEGEDSKDPKLFCSNAAKSFLTRRWKETISGDHVKLVLSPKRKPPDSPESQAAHSASVNGAVKAIFRAKLEKSSRLKYVPKQISNKE
ncbi:hypothetical protein GIB67_013957 [Kingdonia uniflora]|uniref:C2H2-type domain-containing protein n=1 Tax=Kingdonia uniflora TaxID=39325 RepID=A0A7J7LDR9_9MAGN|nr:hypothetical protein GIB67_013957 [Kingdonia uniflora]